MRKRAGNRPRPNGARARCTHDWVSRLHPHTGGGARVQHHSRLPVESRAALGREVCAQFGFVDAGGSAQLAGCLKALGVLETERRIALPGARSHAHRPSSRCLDAPVPAPVDVPVQVRDVEGLRLVAVGDEAQRRMWNTLLGEEHPQGTTTFVGCQLRYLVGSAHGWLGAVGFSASALRLRARDAWMGWSDAQRKAHLHRRKSCPPRPESSTLNATTSRKSTVA